MDDREAFDAKLAAIIDREPASHLLDIPGIYEVLAEHFNNEVLRELEVDKLDLEITPPDDLPTDEVRIALTGGDDHA